MFCSALLCFALFCFALHESAIAGQQSARLLAANEFSHRYLPASHRYLPASHRCQPAIGICQPAICRVILGPRGRLAPRCAAHCAALRGAIECTHDFMAAMLQQLARLLAPWPRHPGLGTQATGALVHRCFRAKHLWTMSVLACFAVLCFVLLCIA